MPTVIDTIPIEEQTIDNLNTCMVWRLPFCFHDQTRYLDYDKTFQIADDAEAADLLCPCFSHYEAGEKILGVMVSLST